MAPMVVERRPRREDFSEPCTMSDRTFFTNASDRAPAIHRAVTSRRLSIARAFLVEQQTRWA
ncbi:hypothetical protein CD790_23265 [Streptomyces sp. SAJ15]|nr:hypothetical protein CD790_23265 [Streptomyces sp. SAJ15]